MASNTTFLALRQLGLQSVKQVYRLETFELREALQNAARRRIDDEKVWDALLYRTALLRSELTPLDLSFAVNALAKSRRKDPGFLEYLLAEVRIKAPKFLVRDVALLLNGFAKLAVKDELLTRTLLPPLLRRITEKTWWEDLALLSLSYARLRDPGRETVSDRIVATLTPRIDKVTDAHALSLLACAFAHPRGSNATSRGDQLFAEEAKSSDEDSTGRLDESDTNEIAHIEFVKVLLEQCSNHMWNFRSADILHLCHALASLSRLGREDAFPHRLLRRLEKRMASTYFDFTPVQFVRLLEQLVHIPELEARLAGNLLNEIAYRIRDLTATSCLSVMRSMRRLGGHPQLQSAVAWRLTRPDASQDLSVNQVCEAVEAIVNFEPRSWEGREALLNLLHGLQRRRQEPEPVLLSRLLGAYGKLSVRDTHWFHICGKLCGPPGGKPQSSQLPELEGFSESVLSDAVMALARLNLPQLAESAALFTRASAGAVRSPRAAADVLEAAAIFELLGRRPNDLMPETLSPLVSVMLDNIDFNYAEEEGATVPRLAPFADTTAAACEAKDLAKWQSRTQSYWRGFRDVEDSFSVAVGQSLESWFGGGSASITVGALRVPWVIARDRLDMPEQDAAEREDGGSRSSRRRSRRVPQPETHLLIDLLRDQDFYHASATVRGERQRTKGQILGASRYAEIAMLRREGWTICCIPEHSWTFSHMTQDISDGEDTTSAERDDTSEGDFSNPALNAADDANKNLVLRLLYSASGDEGRWTSEAAA